MPDESETVVSALDANDSRGTVVPLDCGESIQGADSLLDSGTIIMLGEIHGTVEIPAFIGDLVCLALTHDHRVLLGLEYPLAEQVNIDAYLASDGEAESKRTLLTTGHWQDACPDGRSSQAMFDLIERMRALRRGDHKIDVFAFDPGTYHDWNRRDSGMADNILARAAHAPAAIMLTLTGNLHNRLVAGLPWDDNLIPAGVHVAAAHDRVISLDVRHAGGSSWIQRGAGQCGPAEMAGRPEYEKRFVELGVDAGNAYGSGVFSVGAINAAPPAAAE